MIKLRIENCFTYEDKDGIVHQSPDVKPFDIEKFGNGRVHKFKTLGEVRNFIRSCKIEFTDEYRARFSKWNWVEIDGQYWIDGKDMNTIVYAINVHREYR